jgi:hypothetical protein
MVTRDAHVAVHGLVDCLSLRRLRVPWPNRDRPPPWAVSSWTAPGLSCRMRGSSSRRLAGTTVQSTVADESGTFRIEGVAPGRYDVLAIFDGFEPTTVHVTVGNRAPASIRIAIPIARITQDVTVGTAAA